MQGPKRFLVAVVAMAMASGAMGAASAAVPLSAHDRVVVSGRATVDGVPFDAPYLGAAVKRRGLVTPCQHTLPRVRDGRFEVAVLAQAEGSGCGTAGAEVFLWTFVEGQIVYSSGSVRWPNHGTTAKFHPRFSIAAPNGGVGPISGFAGEIFDQHGTRFPPGRRVEAYIGETRCAVASTRRTGNFIGFSIDVVGPGAIARCTLGATITFRVDGQSVPQTAVNVPAEGSSLNLTLT